MKLITWNVNSIRARLPRVLGVLARHRPDVLCLQETKVLDEAFPREEIEALGYHVACHGQKTYNGVALLTREPARDVVKGFDGDPIPEQARVISATVGPFRAGTRSDRSGVRVINAYVVNGKEVGSDKYQLKLSWLEKLRAWLAAAHDTKEPLIICGDFNITPGDADVHDPGRWAGRILCSEPEREQLRALIGWGLTDLHAPLIPGGGVFTWWDYRAGAFGRGWGLRIDLVLGTRPVAGRVEGVTVDREERKKNTGPGAPSDHAPLVVELVD